MTGWGTPDLKWGTLPPPEMLRSGRYASCVHAGGLSCLLIEMGCIFNEEPLFRLSNDTMNTMN